MGDPNIIIDSIDEDNGPPPKGENRVGDGKNFGFKNIMLDMLGIPHDVKPSTSRGASDIFNCLYKFISFVYSVCVKNLSKIVASVLVEYFNRILSDRVRDLLDSIIKGVGDGILAGISALISILNVVNYILRIVGLWNLRKENFLSLFGDGKTLDGLQKNPHLKHKRAIIGLGQRKKYSGLAVDKADSQIQVLNKIVKNWVKKKRQKNQEVNESLKAHNSDHREKKDAKLKLKASKKERRRGGAEKKWDFQKWDPEVESSRQPEDNKFLYFLDKQNARLQVRYNKIRKDKDGEGVVINLTLAVNEMFKLLTERERADINAVIDNDNALKGLTDAERNAKKEAKIKETLLTLLGSDNTAGRQDDLTDLLLKFRHKDLKDLAYDYNEWNKQLATRKRNLSSACLSAFAYLVRMIAYVLQHYLTVDLIIIGSITLLTTVIPMLCMALAIMSISINLYVSFKRYADIVRGKEEDGKKFHAAVCKKYNVKSWNDLTSGQRHLERAKAFITQGTFGEVMGSLGAIASGVIFIAIATFCVAPHAIVAAAIVCSILTIVCGAIYFFGYRLVNNKRDGFANKQGDKPVAEGVSASRTHDMLERIGHEPGNGSPDPVSLMPPPRSKSIDIKRRPPIKSSSGRAGFFATAECITSAAENSAASGDSPSSSSSSSLPYSPSPPPRAQSTPLF